MNKMKKYAHDTLRKIRPPG